MMFLLVCVHASGAASNHRRSVFRSAAQALAAKHTHAGCTAARASRHAEHRREEQRPSTARHLPSPDGVGPGSPLPSARSRAGLLCQACALPGVAAPPAPASRPASERTHSQVPHDDRARLCGADEPIPVARRLALPGERSTALAAVGPVCAQRLDCPGRDPGHCARWPQAKWRVSVKVCRVPLVPRGAGCRGCCLRSAREATGNRPRPPLPSSGPRTLPRRPRRSRSRAVLERQAR